MDIVVVCHACNRSQSFVDIVPFRADCEGCAADLHVCLNCRFHDRYVDNECREDAADPVSVKDRRNLCEYFKAKNIDGTDADDAATAAKAKLAALFGGPPVSSSAPTASSAAPLSAADEAKRKLEALFKKP